MCVCMRACVRACVHVCMCVRVCVRTYVYDYVFTCVPIISLLACAYVHVLLCLVYMCV